MNRLAKGKRSKFAVEASKRESKGVQSLQDECRACGAWKNETAELLTREVSEASLVGYSPINLLEFML